MSHLVRVARRALAFAIFGAAVASGSAAAAPVTPVAHLDVQRYAGQWRQIASIPQWFEVLCTSDTVANYGIVDASTVRVVNRCFAPGGVEIVTRGRARVLDPVTNAQLQVTFLNLGGGWIYPGSEPNYVVMGLGSQYDWAVVGDPRRTSAFVLARDSQLSPAATAEVVGVLEANGFDACRLRTTPQRAGLRTVRPFC